jgi:hypothetical protein
MGGTYLLGNVARAFPSASAVTGPDQKATGFTRRMPEILDGYVDKTSRGRH